MLLSPVLSVLFIVIFGEYYIVLWSVLAIGTVHCRKKVGILLLLVDHTESIVTVGFHVTTAIMFIANTVKEMC
jgi:hypothetical protein